jgi:hypothetical protein
MAASPYALDLGEPCGRRRYHFGKRSEPGDEVLGERFDVALRDGAEQHELQQFIVAYGLRAGLPEAPAQSLAMAVIVRLVSHERASARIHTS